MPNAQVDPEGNEVPPVNKKKSKLIILSVLVVLVIGLAGGGYWSYSRYLSTEGSGDSHEVHGTLGDQSHPVPGELISLEPFLVNLANPGGRTYLKVKIELEASDKTAVGEIEQSMPRVRDAIILLLSSKTYEDVANLQGKEQLRQEILAKLRTLPGGQDLIGAYFTEFVSQ